MKKPIAKYRFILAAGSPLLFGFQDIFGIREKNYTQVQIKAFGNFVWINVAKKDIFPL